MSELAERLTTYLRLKLPDVEDLHIGDLNRLPGGASRESWSFDLNWQECRTKAMRFLPCIVRRDMGGGRIETPLSDEAFVLRGLAGSGCPVPKVWWFESDAAWLGQPFMVMERLPGIAAPTFAAMGPGIEIPDSSHTIEDFTGILARLHLLDWRILRPVLEAPTRPEHAAIVEIERWQSSIQRHSLEEQPSIDFLHSWLRRNAPCATATAIVHGDYRLGNVLLERGTITAVLDWEMTHVGDPLEDLGWVTLPIWHGNGRVCGLVEEDDFCRRYERHARRCIDRSVLRFYQVFSCFKMVAIQVTAGRAYVDGRSGDLFSAYTSYNVPRYLLTGLTLINKRVT